MKENRPFLEKGSEINGKPLYYFLGLGEKEEEPGTTTELPVFCARRPPRAARLRGLCRFGTNVGRGLAGAAAVAASFACLAAVRRAFGLGSASEDLWGAESEASLGAIEGSTSFLA